MACISILLLSAITAAQKADPGTYKLKQTKFVSRTTEFGPGGTISIIGAPKGSIKILGWAKNEVSIEAEIEVRAANEADLGTLAGVCGFVLDKSVIKVSVISVGPHDKKYLKRAAKKFPKRLRGMPCRVDYTVKVPLFSDLVIDGGDGDFDLSGVEGSMRIKFLTTKARLALTGGAIQATFGKADVEVVIARRSWRGRFAEVLLVSGRLNVILPNRLNANLKAKVLRAGKIENGYRDLKASRGTVLTEKNIDAIAGNGGASLSFTVGDGNLKIKSVTKMAKSQD